VGAAFGAVVGAAFGAVAAAAFVAVGVRIGVALAVLLVSAVEGPAVCVSRAAAGPFADRAVVVRLPGRAVVRRSVVRRAPGLPLGRVAGSRCAVPVAERWRLAQRGMLLCADRVATPLSASGAAITAAAITGVAITGAAITGAAITAAIILGVASLPVSWQVLHWEPLLRAIRTTIRTRRPLHLRPLHLRFGIGAIPIRDITRRYPNAQFRGEKLSSDLKGISNRPVHSELKKYIELEADRPLSAGA
jgi:hypothetical protein